MKSITISLINFLIILLVIFEFCGSEVIELTQSRGKNKTINFFLLTDRQRFLFKIYFKASVNSAKNIEVYVNGKKVKLETDAKILVNSKAKRNLRTRPRRRPMRTRLSMTRFKSLRNGYPNRGRGRGINNVNRNNVNVNIKIVINIGKTQVPGGYTNDVTVSGGYPN
jgi:hypothetical protein